MNSQELAGLFMLANVGYWIFLILWHRHSRRTSTDLPTWLRRATTILVTLSTLVSFAAWLVAVYLIGDSNWSPSSATSNRQVEAVIELTLAAALLGTLIAVLHLVANEVFPFVQHVRPSKRGIPAMGPWIYSGLPHSPRWWRNLYFRIASYSSQRRDKQDIRLGRRVSLIGIGKPTRMARARRFIRVRLLVPLAEPAGTFMLTFIGGSVFALQLDRLTDEQNGGSWALLAAASLMLLVGSWLARSRDLLLQYQAEQAASKDAQEQIEALTEENERITREHKSEVVEAIDAHNAQIHASIRELHEAIERLDR